MFVNEFEEEIMTAITNKKIEREVQVFTDEEKHIILKKIQEIFVCGNPRVWWLALKYKPKSYVFKGKESYKKIADFFDKEENVWFIIEEDRLLYKTKILYIIDIIADCSYFEYYIISEKYDRFLCETDHGEFLFVDRR